MIRIALSFALFALATAATGQVTVKDPWVRATVPAQRATAAFMQLVAAQGTRLVAASSPVAGMAEIHEMSMVDGVMKMRAIKALDLPAGKAVVLDPGGYHVMLLELKSQVRVGDVVPLTLVFEDRENRRTTVDVKAPVRALAEAPAPGMPMK
ncbi:MAG TPA: copper chaperone PCu(A)C [Casimicrobiaceae bacterium]|nr:copper chaperone PCu(A)C [Casimicrobiaceae bacterium]